MTIELGRMPGQFRDRGREWLKFGQEVRQFPASVKEIFSLGEQPPTPAIITAAATAAGLALALATAAIANPQTNSLIRNTITLIEGGFR